MRISKGLVVGLVTGILLALAFVGASFVMIGADLRDIDEGTKTLTLFGIELAEGTKAAGVGSGGAGSGGASATVQMSPGGVIVAIALIVVSALAGFVVSRRKNT